MGTGAAGGDRWQQMQGAIHEARAKPAEVMAAISDARDRPTAARSLAELLGCDTAIADQLLDAHLAEFIGRRTARETSRAPMEPGA